MVGSGSHPGIKKTPDGGGMKKRGRGDLAGQTLKEGEGRYPPYDREGTEKWEAKKAARSTC